MVLNLGSNLEFDLGFCVWFGVCFGDLDLQYGLIWDLGTLILDFEFALGFCV